MKVSVVALLALILIASCSVRCATCRRNNFKSASIRKLYSASPARGLSVVFKTANGRSLELNTEQQVKLISAIAGIVA